MTELAARDFNIHGIACHWHAQPPDTLGKAREFLRDVAGAGVAGALQRDVRGRPRLPAGMGDIGWSHGGGRMLLARVASGHIGVDVETLARRAEVLRIARRHFAETEIILLESLDADARNIAFLYLWCAKEAVLKAHGHGIAFGLARIAFDVADDQLRMTHCDKALGDITAWRLHAFTPEPGYLAVLAHCNGILRA